jgi:hypothetical protein
VCVVALLCARSAVAQDGELGRWQPQGPVPVDQAGAGRRGYSLPGEGADVTDPGASQVSIHTVSANNFYVEQTGSLLISQRSETHTLALEYRRGFKTGWLPRFELGAQMQVSETDAGMLNGFISGFENFVHAPLRSKAVSLPPLGTYVMKDGRAIYQSAGDGSGLGDVTFVAKALLRDRSPESRDTRVAARITVNVSGTSEFTEGNFAGVGVSVDRKLTEWVAFHGDVRASLSMDTVSTWGLPLTRGVLAFSVGPEVKLTRHTSLNLQFDGSTSPYKPTGTVGLDAGYGDIAFGLNRGFSAGRRDVVVQLYGRENMNLPLNVRWNTDPDLAVGMKVTIR